MKIEVYIAAESLARVRIDHEPGQKTTGGIVVRILEEVELSEAYGSDLPRRSGLRYFRCWRQVYEGCVGAQGGSCATPRVLIADPVHDENRWVSVDVLIDNAFYRFWRKGGFHTGAVRTA
jgi:hypothetical protein